MNKTKEDSLLSRREFLKCSAALGVSSLLPPVNPAFSLNETQASQEGITQEFWGYCSTNCIGRCALQVRVKNGVINSIGTDDTGSDQYGEHQLRACLRGRSMRKLVYSPDRLRYPLKRAGPRGDGKFVRISWDEALSFIAQRLTKTIKKYGNESVFIAYGSGVIDGALSCSLAPDTPINRLMNCLGGCLGFYGTYSTGQIREGLKYLYGEWQGGSSLTTISQSKLVVFFGFNPALTHMGGAGFSYDLWKSLQSRTGKFIVIDPQYTETAAKADEWIPLRPGTDAALAAGLAYVMISENLVDENFLHTYTQGYDAATMPPGVDESESYKAYILGQGRDKTPKTPAWAEHIAGVSRERITNLAREIAKAKPCYIAQGWGVQRQANGEQNSRAICMLPILTGNVGVAGGSNGGSPNGFKITPARLPTLRHLSRTQAEIPVFLWSEAVKNAAKMTDLSHGVRGVEKLNSDIKFIWNYAGNTLMNQHSDLNACQELLKDESKCETIVVIDHFMTPTGKMADILLPSATSFEKADFVGHYRVSEMAFLICCQPAIPPFYESKDIWDICAELSVKLGIEDVFSEGRTRDEWIEFLYQKTRNLVPNGNVVHETDKADESNNYHFELPPTFAEACKTGVFKKRLPQRVALEAFRKDPVANPLKTPSGKIEIFSTALWAIAENWILPPGEKITALPEYSAIGEGIGNNLMGKYPLQLLTPHPKQRTHSTFATIDWLQRISPQRLIMNPADAALRKIANKNLVKIFNERGEVIVEVNVSSRIMPGVVALPQGAWFDPDKNGIDRGGNANVLTSQAPSPIAKGNPQNSTLVEVEKVKKVAT